tara:strand:- start:1389 stop:1838 length:450 start_codon:yes stop_codon:yes gene_type:complete
MKIILSNAKTLINILLIIFTLIFTLVANPLSSYAIGNKEAQKISQLENKIATNYSNKLCNAIGIGMSLESATKLAIIENSNPKFNPSLWFELTIKGDDKIKKIDSNSLSTAISTKVIDDCGPALDLRGQEGIESFKSYFISRQKETLKD